MPQAAVIIPHYNDVVRLDRCLEALLPQVGAETEVVVADNMSTEPLESVQARFPQVRFVAEPQKGAAHARNRGVQESDAERLFFLDCDCVPGPDWLAQAFEVGERADVIGGAIAVFDETSPPRSGAQAFETVFAFDNRSYLEKKGFSVTANLLTTRRVFEAVGGFRSGLSEDLDWCQRAMGADFSLAYAEDLRVSHPTRSDWPSLERKWRRLTEEAWGLRSHSFVDRLQWALRGLAVLGSAVVHAPRLLFSAKLSGAGERARGLGALVRLRTRRCGWMLWQAMGRSI